MLSPFPDLEGLIPRLGEPRRRPRRRRLPQLSPEEQQSILRSLAGVTISGLGYVGGALDKPGAAVRGVASGLTGGPWGGGLLNLIPFSAALGITDPKERVYGRQLLEQWGAFGPKRPGSYWGDVAGFGLELATDPLLWLSFGGGALSKGGQLAKRAGLVEKAVGAAGPGAGKRVARLTMTPRKVLQSLPKAERRLALKAWQRAAHAKGMPVSGRKKLLDQPLGGLLGIGPLGSSRWGALGSGPRSQWLARQMDIAGEAIRYSPLIRPLAKRFYPPAGEATSKIGQQVSEALYPARREGTTAAREAVIPEVRRIHAAQPTQQELVALQEAIEEAPVRSGTLPKVPEALEPTRASFRGMMDDAIAEEHYWGVDSQGLNDRMKYLARQQAEMPSLYRKVRGGKAAGRRPAAVHRVTVGRFGMKREPLLTDYPGGTAVLQEMSIDPRLSGTARRGAELEADMAYMLQQYGHRLGEIDPKKAIQLARYMADLPEWHREMGIPIFSTDIAGVVSKRVEYSKQAVNTAQRIRDQLARVAVVAGKDPPGSKTLTQAIQEIGLTSEKGKAAAARLVEEMRRLGKDVDARTLHRWFVPQEYIDEMTRTMKPLTSEETIGGLRRAIDAGLNWWRAVHTTFWPGYLSRNFGGGIVQNWFVAGGSPLRVLRRIWDMDRMVRGKPIRGALGHPLVKQMQREGAKIATDEQATRALADIMAAHRPFGPLKGQALEMPGATASLASEIPGMEKFPGIRRTFASGLPGKDPRTWMFWKTRGVGGLTEDIFGPVAGGRAMNSYVEALLRGGLWLDLTKQGWDAAAATAKTDAAHVAYGVLTEFERKYARTAMPFYTFMAGQARFLAKELMERPGGPHAQAIRAANAMRERDPFVPDYLAQSLTVPVPAGFPLIGPKPGGDPRYVGGFGLMHEDPVQLLGGGPGLQGRVTGGLQELFSRSGPWAKIPELALQRSFWQAGPRGGRALEDMDPMIGRLLANVSGRERPVRFPGSALVEHLVGGIWGRPFSTARTLTDPRKRWGQTVLPGPAALSNVLTGIKLYDLPQARQEKTIREALDAELRKTGLARGFEETYIPQELKAELPAESQASVERLLAMKRLLSQRARQRAKGIPVEAIRTW